MTAVVITARIMCGPGDRAQSVGGAPDRLGPSDGEIDASGRVPTAESIKTLLA
jgi:hypothetical protein